MEIVIPKNAPVRGQSSYTSQDTHSDFSVYHYARSGRKVIMGPMPVVEFLDEFLPSVTNTKHMPGSLGAFSRVPRKPNNDRDISNYLVEAINHGKRCPSINFCNTASASEGPPSMKPEPNICGYSQADMHLMTADGATPNMGFAELFFVVQNDRDPFCDSHSHTKTSYRSFFAFENRKYESDEDVEQGRSERRLLGQCIGLAAEACARQHRCFFFSVLVVGTRARFFRWDRAGAIVTKAFDFKDEPELMCEFLWRFHLANPVQRGFDPTVSVASRAEEELFKKLIKSHAAFQLGISEDDSEKLEGALSEHYESGKVTKVEIYERGRSKPDYYLVSVSLSCPRSVTGHSTRAYWSVKLTGQDEGTVCFLKDTWRLEMSSMRSECNIYEEMQDMKVENICDLECYGDVPGIGSLDETDEHDCASHQEQSPEADAGTIPIQRTRTQEFIDAGWVCDCLRKWLDARVIQHTHSRIVLRQAGYSLRTFTGSRELFGATRDALEALDTAYKRCRRVHRDVSLNNIILYRSEPSGPRRGLLIDWEFSTVVNTSGYVDDDLRSGTWAFMSGNALFLFRSFHHGIEDDLESLFYVVMYSSLRWLPHDYVERLGSWMYSFFDQVLPGGPGQSTGGRDKLFEIAFNGSPFLDLFKFDNRFVQDWFKYGYALLGTASDHSKNAGQECLWTTEKLRDLITIVCRGLARTKGTECDRTDHELEGYVEDTASRDTEISLLAAARIFHIDHSEPESFQKRPADVAFEDDAEDASSKPRLSERRSCKRKRVANRRTNKTAPGGKTSDNARGVKRSGVKRAPTSKNPANSDTSRSDMCTSYPYKRSIRIRSLSGQTTRKSPRLEAKRCPSKSVCPR